MDTYQEYTRPCDPLLDSKAAIQTPVMSPVDIVGKAFSQWTNYGSMIKSVKQRQYNLTMINTVDLQLSDSYRTEGVLDYQKCLIARGWFLKTEFWFLSGKEI